MIRNAEMAKVADALIAFWDGKSRGTAHMINFAKRKGLDVYVVDYSRNTTLHTHQESLFPLPTKQE